MPLIRLENARKTYRENTPAKVEALQDLSFSVNAGEIVAVVGKSGSGKSTLLHILGCIDTLTSGRYYLNDEEINTQSVMELAYIRNKRIGFVLQNFGLLMNRSVRDNVLLPIFFSKNKDKKSYSIKMETILEQLGIVDKKTSLVGELSGGQKQRVAVARAIINDPEIILADEPTGALDQKTSVELIEILQQLNQSGKTIIIVTHDTGIARQCKRNIEIADGLIIRDEWLV